MNKYFKIYLIALIIVIGLLSLIQFNKVPIIDWRKNYSPDEKTPFGLYVFEQEMPNLLENDFEVITQSPYDYYSSREQVERDHILIINYDFDEESWKKIFQRVEKGAMVLCISDQYVSYLFDKFNIESSYYWNEDPCFLSFSDTMRKSTIMIDKLPNISFYNSFNRKDVEVLGFASCEGEKERSINFLKLRYGEGSVLLHSEPLFLTNYYLLKKENQHYVEDVFSYFPTDQKTLIFRSKKEENSDSVMRFILREKSLRNAWYILLLGLTLFVVFRGKRRQRIIPVIEPLKNRSVEFVKMIGNLYFNEGKVKDMMRKKAIYFSHQLRKKYFIDSTNLNEEFIQKLEQKLTISREEAEEVVKWLKIARDQRTSVMEKDLIQMNMLFQKVLQN